MRADRFLAATLLLVGCTSSAVPSGTASSTAAPSSAEASAMPSTAEPSPTGASTLSNPRGSAINGPIVYSEQGDVFSLDPATGVSTLMFGGPTTDEAPYFSPDGTNLVVHRSDDGMLYISSPVGSGLKPWADDQELNTWTWSPDGSRLAAIPVGGTAHDLIIWDGGAGKKTHLNVDATATFPMWVDLDTLLLIEENADLSAKFWTVSADGTGLKKLAALHPSIGVSIHLETGELAYSDFVLDAGSSSSIHVLNLVTGKDSILASTVVAGESYLSPLFSPDGNWIVANQFAPGLPAHRPVLIFAGGTEVARPLGPNPTENLNIHAVFSPDSTRVLLTSPDGVFLFSIPDGAGGRVDWPIGSTGPEENAAVWLRSPG